jgi:hypothetical protein
LVKAYAIAGDGIDMGGRNAFGSVAAAVGRNIVDTKIIDHDDDDIGRSLSNRCGLREWALNPGHFLVGPTRVPNVGVPT